MVKERMGGGGGDGWEDGSVVSSVTAQHDTGEDDFCQTYEKGCLAVSIMVINITTNVGGGGGGSKKGRAPLYLKTVDTVRCRLSTC